MAGPGSRRRAREHALQILYSLDVGGLLGEVREHPESVEPIASTAFCRYRDSFEEEPDDKAQEFAETLVRGTLRALVEIDDRIQQASRNWRLERMSRVDRNILRTATFEILHLPEIPARVIINEAIEVAKRFGASESPAFVNGLLDRISQGEGRE